jgi:uncharacterized membrane protein YwaF
MNITASDVILMAHATLGVLGTVAAVWVFVEALNAQESNAARTRTASFAVAAFMIATWIVGGYWYIHFYPPEKAIILMGPWPFAHNLFMETKEHLFLATLVLALYLPFAAAEKLYANRAARNMVLCTALLIAFTGLAIEGAGAIINHGVKVALAATVKSASAGAQK